MPHVNSLILKHALVWIIGAIVSGFLTGLLAQKKNQSFIKWFFLGMVAPFVSLIGLSYTKDNPDNKDFYLSDKGYTHLRRWYAVLVTFMAFLVYAQTAQPTVSFWDCGEFIACSYSLSVPHPPGAPIFLLLGRITSILPLDFLAPLWGLEELTVAHKMNLMSGLFNAMAIGVLFLIVTKAVEKMFLKLHRSSEYAIVLAAGMVGSLLAAFAYTYWNNAVEAEVYGPAMFITNLVIYFAMLWYRKREKPMSDRYLVFIPFILYLGIGIHLTVMIMLPPIFLFVIFCSPEKRKDPFFWLTWIILFSVATTFNLFLIVMGLGLILSFLGAIIYGLTSKTRKSWVGRSLGLMFITLLLAGVAFGASTYTLIRSEQDPLIDENDPETIEGFADYMDRKQYGQESMWETMVKNRKGTWKNQLGTHPRMGFWGFFMQQWSNPKLSLWGLLPFAVGLVGLIFFGSKHKQFWLLLFLALLVSTLGLVIYINFSDGTQGIKLEVRDRDYFFTPGYMLFSGWIGIGIGAILAFFNYLRRQAKLSPVFTTILAFILTLIPVVPLKANWFTHDRSGNYIPHDYAYNILNSCDPNCILFTNGDNDTFPLWFLQVVKQERDDVCIANLSLLNTPWYIKQLKTRKYFQYTGVNNSGRKVTGEMQAENEMELKRKLSARGINLSSSEITKVTNQFGHDFVPIAYTDKEIDQLRAYRTRNGEIVRVQDLMVIHLIDHTESKMVISDLEEPDTLTSATKDTTYVFNPPVYFAVTVSPDNKLHYTPYLRMEGLAYRLTGKKGERQVEPDIMKDYLFNKYLFRGLNDSTIYKDDNSNKLLQNYTTAFMTLALEFKMSNESEEALKVMEEALLVLPYDWRVTMFTADLYAESKEWDRMKGLFDYAMENDSNNVRLIRVFSDLAYQNGDTTGAIPYLEEGRKYNPDDDMLFKTLLGYYYVLGMNDEMNNQIEKWLENHPDDQQLRSYLESVQARKQQKPIVVPSNKNAEDIAREQPNVALPSGREVGTGPIEDKPQGGE